MYSHPDYNPTGAAGSSGSADFNAETMKNDPMIRELDQCWKAHQSIWEKTETFTQQENIPPTIRELMKQVVSQQFTDRIGEVLNRHFKREEANASYQQQSTASANPGPSHTVSGKRLYRVEKNKTIAGVCTGLAEYFEVDISLIRVAFVLTSFFYGIGLLAYVILMVILPVKNEN